MNLLTQHLEQPSHRFVTQRAHTEQRLGCRIWKYFCDEPPPAAPSRTEIDRLLAENERLRKGAEEARIALGRAFGDD